MAADQDPPSFLKKKKRETRLGAIVAFFRDRPLESLLFVAVLLMLLIKSCSMDAAKENLYRWGPASLTGTGGPINGPEAWENRRLAGELAPPPPAEKTAAARPFSGERGQPVDPGKNQGMAAAGSTLPSSSHRLDFANPLDRIPQSQNNASSGAIYPESPGPGQASPEGRDPLGLIARGALDDTAPQRGDQYPEVPKGLEGKDLVEAMRDEGLIKELKDYAKHETWKSLEKAPKGITMDSLSAPCDLNELKNSLVCVEILKTKRATDSALYCGGSCKVEKRIGNNRATFYGEKY